MEVIAKVLLHPGLLFGYESKLNQAYIASANQLKRAPSKVSTCKPINYSITYNIIIEIVVGLCPSYQIERPPTLG